jgi:hypothetical protein
LLLELRVILFNSMASVAVPLKLPLKVVALIIPCFGLAEIVAL